MQMKVLYLYIFTVQLLFLNGGNGSIARVLMGVQLLTPGMFCSWQLLAVRRALYANCCNDRQGEHRMQPEADVYLLLIKTAGLNRQTKTDNDSK